MTTSEGGTVTEGTVATAETATSAGEVTTPAAESGQSAPALDLSAYGTHMVPVKVDGQEQLVPLSEAIAGFQRQSDYTRKTQELAERSKQLQTAQAVWELIQSDPYQAISDIAAHFGVDLSGNQEPDDPDFEPDPAEQAMSRVEQLERQLQLEKQQAILDKQLQELRSTYGEFDQNELLQFAVSNGIVRDLKVAYKAWKADEWAEQARMVAEKREAESAAEQAKRDIAFMEGGSHVNNVTDVPPNANGKKLTIREQFLMAKKQLGMA